MHSVQVSGDITEAAFIIPAAAPFFENSLKIFTLLNHGGTQLQLNVDYFLTHHFVAASDAYGKAIYGVIAFTNSAYAGNVYLDYQTLGGDFVVTDIATLTEITKKYYADVRFTTWDQLTGVPSLLPPVNHAHDVSDVKTLADVVTALESIASSLVGNLATTGNGGASDAALVLIQSHLAATQNAHTASAVGLGNVPNYAAASETDAQQNRSDRLMTPLITSYMVKRATDALGVDVINDTIKTIQTSIASINLTLTNLMSANTSFNTALGLLATNVNQYRADVATLTTTVNNAVDTANLANTTATAAVAQVTAAMANVDQLISDVNNAIYLNTSILPVGSHYINIPAGRAMQFDLIGGGGASGKYYNTVADQVVYSGGPLAGEDSVVYYAGTYTTPIEPVPMLIASGGLAGGNTYGSIGKIGGGKGGTPYVFRSNRIAVSQITSIALAVDLIVDPTGIVGAAGTSGDTAATASNVSGVGGYTINASADDFHQTYGRGRRGSTRAGLVNDQTEAIRVIVNVGRGGRVARASLNDDLTTYTEDATSNGVAILTPVV
ncbi:MAG: hypothetical protein [Bacteriophage sp.]|nr:MAG: hypothetical protein [Bacteriophage sp.]